jgi:hypothetical protein
VTTFGPPQAQRDDAGDRARLSLVAAGLDAAGVRWWVDHGTLLGLVREGRPLPWDDDLDVSFEHADLPRVVAALTLAKAGLAARVVRTGRGVKVLPHEPGGRVLDLAPYHRVGDDVLEKAFVRVPQGDGGARRGLRSVARGALVRAEAALSTFDRWVWSRRRWSPAATRVLIAVVGWPAALRDRIGHHQPSRVPRSVFETLGSVLWDDLRLPAPADAESYLALRYGEDWRTPQVAWTWWDDDRTVGGPNRP